VATGYVPEVQGECRKSHQKFSKSEKRHQCSITHGTYNATKFRMKSNSKW
jgi:hypothetical protein